MTSAISDVHKWRIEHKSVSRPKFEEQKEITPFYAIRKETIPSKKLGTSLGIKYLLQSLQNFLWNNTQLQTQYWAVFLRFILMVWQVR